MYAAERQRAILDIIGRDGRVGVSDVAQLFDVSSETVRRDLGCLERSGQVRRVHGGAVPTAAVRGLELGLAERDVTRAAEKLRIAHAAVALLPEAGGSILIDAGTTTARFAASLPIDRDLTVVTNAVPIAARLAALPNVDLRMLGGSVRGKTQAAVGYEALTALSNYRVDVAFLGTNAVSLDFGLSTPDSTEAAVKRAMAQAARRVVLLTDSTKFGDEQFIRFAPMDTVSAVVTDRNLSTEILRQLEDKEIEVVLA